MNRLGVSDGRNGFLVPTDHPRELASRIAAVLKDYELRISTSKLNSDITKKKGDWNNNMIEMEELCYILHESS